MPRLTGGAQRFAAGRQYADVRRRRHNLLGQRRDRADDVLAVVEHQQRVPVTQPCNQSRNRIGAGQGYAKHTTHGAGHQLRSRHRRECDKPDAVLERSNRSLGNGGRDRCLADPAGPDDGQEPAAAELCQQCRDGGVAADDARQRRRNMARAGDQRRRGQFSDLRAELTSCRRHEDVAAAGNIGDEAVAFATVTQGLAERRDMHP